MAKRFAGPVLSEPTIASDNVVRVVTGERGTGKSTLCRRVAAKARDAGLIVTGVVTHDNSDNGTRHVTDLRTGENRLFGTQTRPRAAFEPNGSQRVDPLTPSWMYDEGVFAWGNNALARSTPCDLLVIDELGPLEILGDRGWFTAFEVLSRRQFGAALVVCRPALVFELAARIEATQPTVYEVSVGERDALFGTVLGDLLGEG